MDKFIPFIIAGVVALLWLLGNASWILVLLNLLWMFFKGAALVSWVIVGGVIGSFVILLILFLGFFIWAKS